MAGDEVSAQTIYYYQNAVTNTSGGTSFLTDVVNGIVQAISGSATSSLLKSNATAIGTQLNANAPFKNIAEPDYTNATGTNPKAYLSVIFFDERFNVVTEGSISKRVLQAGPGTTPLSVVNQKAPKNGYCMVYVSNESDEMVYFDNLQVTNTHARIIEENHYYAYGLKIAAISSKKLGDVNEGQLKNNYQYQGDYSEMDEDIGWNDFELRNYDPQIGRWIQQDPYDEFPSPYIGMGNDPLNNVDPTGGFLGLSPLVSIGVSTFAGAAIGGLIDVISGGDGTTGMAIGAAAGLFGGIGGNFGISTIAGGVTQSLAMFASNQAGGKIIITPRAAADPSVAQAIEYVQQSGLFSDIFTQVTSGSLGNTNLVFDIGNSSQAAGNTGIYGYDEELGDFLTPLSEWAQNGYLQEKHVNTNMALQLRIEISRGFSVGYNTETITHELIIHATGMIVLIKYLRTGATPENIVKTWSEKTQSGGFANDKRQHKDFINPKSGLRKAFDRVISGLSKFIKNISHRAQLKKAVLDDIKVNKELLK